MGTVILEGGLFVAAVAAGAALVFFGARELTPFGVWLRQRGNRKRIEREAALACPVHGPHREQDLVRLRTGEVMCPACFKEMIDG